MTNTDLSPAPALAARGRTYIAFGRDADDLEEKLAALGGPEGHGSETEVVAIRWMSEAEAQTLPPLPWDQKSEAAGGQG